MDTTLADTIDTMDQDEPQMLPELSFEDLLDDSPAKKRFADSDSDPLDLDDAMSTRTPDDDTLNTPKPKKHPSHSQPAKQQTQIEHAPNEPDTTPPNTNTDPLAIEQDGRAADSNERTKTATATTSTTPATSCTTTTVLNKPIVLNGQNILPKTAGNQLIKIAPRLVGAATGSATTTLNVVKATGGTTIHVTPIKTVSSLAAAKAVASTTASAPTNASTKVSSSGQIIYIQKSAASTLGGGKFVVQRANGKQFVVTNPNVIKLSPKQPMLVTSTAATATATATATTAKIAVPSAMLAAAKTEHTTGTLTLSTKTPPTTTTTTTTLTNLGVKATGATLLSATKCGSKIVVNGKQYIMKPNQKFIKLAAGSTAATMMAAATAATSAATTSATATAAAAASGDAAQQRVHAIPIPGKQLQYVQNANGKQIVMTNIRMVPKVNLGSAAATPVVTTIPTTTTTTTTVAATTTSATGAAATTTATTTTPTTATASATTATSATPTGPAAQPVKILNSLPQKLTLTLSPKLVKNIFLRPSAHDSSKKETPSTATASAPASSTSSQPTQINDPAGLLGKRKISDLNSEIKRVTDGDASAPEIKKTASGSRIVVVPRSMLKPAFTSSASAASTSAVGTMQISRSALVQRMPVQGTTNKSSTTVATTTTNTTTTTTSSSASSNTTPNTSASASTSTTSTGGIHYSIVQSPKKLYTVLKANTNPNNGGDPSTAQVKSLVLCNSSALRQQNLAKPQQNVTASLVLNSNNVVVIRAPTPAAESTASKAKVGAATAVASGKSAGTPQVKEETPDVMNELDLKIKGGIVRRKHCNCSKSQCLKLYCDCFANGEFCFNCTCKDCFNNLQFEDERQRAIKNCLERNPRAFKPKITAARDDMRSHNKGCNCKRSGCLKNYCECYEAKIPCSSNCKCMGCRNVEDRPDLDMDPHEDKSAVMGMAGKGKSSKRHSYQKSGKDAMYDDSGNVITGNGSSYNATDDSSHSGGSTMSGLGGDGHGFSGAGDAPNGDKQRCNVITNEVVDATVQCMFSQADECIKSDLPAYQCERMVMEEMGRCLVEIIDFSIRNTELSFTQE